ncbi:type IV pilin [Natronosalvus amylolyticus]|uniref:type IV pilin n=1 Tax=Natronosalvus amylolyticus TaxID=2961994 RepID=UPI0020CA0CBE|nr:type IV pilin N-terminal domain-containing protein [Natronosalvus amylolyticus]
MYYVAAFSPVVPAAVQPVRPPTPTPCLAITFEETLARLRCSSSGSIMHRRGPRGVSPLVGTVLFLGITVLLAGTLAIGVAPHLASPSTATPGQALELEADADRDELVFDLVAGNAIDVRELEVHVTIDDEPLEFQPPVPFVGAHGFRGAPDGPFNGATDPQWRPGERAAVRLAGTNAPALEEGSVVRAHLTVDGQTIARLVTVAC